MGSGSDIPTSPSPSPGAVGPVATATLSDDGAQFASPAGVSALIAADLMPVVGVLFLGWQVFPIVLLYWLENVVVGVITVLKMTYAQGSSDPVVEGGDPAAHAGEKPRGAIVVFPSATRFDATAGTAAKAMTIVFFCCHYGMFTMIQGIFVFVVFGTAALETHAAGSGALAPGFWWWLALAFLGLCVSHGVSFWRNYLGAGEYRSLSPQALMTQPYGRVVVMQLTVILGGILIDAMGTPLAGLLLLVGLKTGLDVITHRREHRKVLSRVASTG